MHGFDQFLRRLEAQEIASSSALVGCSSEEIAALEDRYNLRLPKSYRRYLEVMGHKSGRLFAHDHMDVFYRDVMEMTDDQRELLLKEEAEFELPPDALIIAGRLGEQFQLIRCNEEGDSPVFYYAEWDLEIKEVFDSVLGWLEIWAAKAREAIESGWFEGKWK